MGRGTLQSGAHTSALQIEHWLRPQSVFSELCTSGHEDFLDRQRPTNHESDAHGVKASARGFCAYKSILSSRLKVIMKKLRPGHVLSLRLIRSHLQYRPSALSFVLVPFQDTRRCRLSLIT